MPSLDAFFLTLESVSFFCSDMLVDLMITVALSQWMEIEGKSSSSWIEPMTVCNYPIDLLLCQGNEEREQLGCEAVISNAVAIQKSYS